MTYLGKFLQIANIGVLKYKWHLLSKVANQILGFFLNLINGIKFNIIGMRNEFVSLSYIPIKQNFCYFSAILGDHELMIVWVAFR